MDKQKADSIVIEYLPKIYGFSVNKSFSYDEAEEICAEIVKELYDSLLKSKSIYNLDGYVWNISKHVYSKYVSSVKKRREIAFEGNDTSIEDVYDFVEDMDELLRLRREISFLTKIRREIVYSYYYENKTIALISVQKGIPIGTVKWHLNKARKELKEGFVLERKVGKLGMKPVKAASIGHNGMPGENGGPEFYIRDNLDLNIIYSVYYQPRTKEEIAEELGITPVFIEDKIDILNKNGFLVQKAGGKYTTLVYFDLPTYSLQAVENITKKQLEIAQILAKDYVPSIISAVENVENIYIPGGNHQLLEAAAIFYGVSNKCKLDIKKDLSSYFINTTDGGHYIACIELEKTQSDPDYMPVLNIPSMSSCGSMERPSCKYPIYSWSVDSRYSSRKGGWQNNLLSDYEYLYEFMTGTISETSANEEKFKRLREREFISAENEVNVMVIKEKPDDFFAKIPQPDEKIMSTFADYILESVQISVRDYPAQMQDLVVSFKAGEFCQNTVALMVMDILYGNGTFRTLNERERITSNLILFADVLPKK